ncbi:MAG: hypothetical protein ACR2P5_00565 [Gammaproteobacteria bacterium]
MMVADGGTVKPEYQAQDYEMNRPYRHDIDWSKHSFGIADAAYSATPPSPRVTSRDRDGTANTDNNLEAYA